MVVEKQKKEGEEMQKCNSEIVKKKIELLLLSNDLSRSDLAKAIGIDESTLSKKMNGYVDWKLSECISTSKFLGKAISEIFLSNELQ